MILDPHDTLIKFHYPKTIVMEYEFWVVLVRVNQVNPGSLVIVCKEPAQALGEVSAAAWVEFQLVAKETEAALTSAFGYDKINYLALMMKDREVHFHVIPRYADKQRFLNQDWIDVDWPEKTNLGVQTVLDDDQILDLAELLKKAWHK